MQKPSVIFFGNERIATAVTTTCPVLQTLISEGYDIKAVVISHHDTRSRKIRELEVETIAKQQNLPIIKVSSSKEVFEKIKDIKADIGVLVAFGQIVHQSVIDLFPHGILNIHPSLLPKHRGSIPIESVILNGEGKTGVSLMKLVKEMDAGPVYAYSELDLDGSESKQQLADTLSEIGSNLVKEVLPMIISGECQPQPQDEAQATYDQQIEKVDGEVSLSKSAVQLEHEIRAYLNWPGSRTVIAGKDVAITEVRLATDVSNVENKTTFISEKRLFLQSSDGILEILELKPAGKSTMTAEAFLAGYKHLI